MRAAMVCAPQLPSPTIDAPHCETLASGFIGFAPPVAGPVPPALAPPLPAVAPAVPEVPAVTVPPCPKMGPLPAAPPLGEGPPELPLIVEPSGLLPHPVP